MNVSGRRSKEARTADEPWGHGAQVGWGHRSRPAAPRPPRTIGCEWTCLPSCRKRLAYNHATPGRVLAAGHVIFAAPATRDHGKARLEDRHRGSPTSPTANGGVARIAFQQARVRNAFRPHTVSGLLRAFHDTRRTRTSGWCCSRRRSGPKDGIWSFCSGGDQRARGHQGTWTIPASPRLNILEVQRMIQDSCPKW